MENLVDVYRAGFYCLMVQKLRGSKIKREEAIVIKSPDTLGASRFKPVSEIINLAEREENARSNETTHRYIIWILRIKMMYFANTLIARAL